MPKKQKCTHAERIAAKVAGEMIIKIRAWTHQGEVSGLYWRGFQAGVRLTIMAIREAHRTARAVARWESLQRRTKALLDRIDARRAKP